MVGEREAVEILKARTVLGGLVARRAANRCRPTPGAQRSSSAQAPIPRTAGAAERLAERPSLPGLAGHLRLPGRLPTGSPAVRRAPALGPDSHPRDPCSGTTSSSAGARPRFASASTSRDWSAIREPWSRSSPARPGPVRARHRRDRRGDGLPGRPRHRLPPADRRAGRRPPRPRRPHGAVAARRARDLTVKLVAPGPGTPALLPRRSGAEPPRYPHPVRVKPGGRKRGGDRRG